MATSAGDIPELVGSPDNAILVPPGDSRLLAEVLASLVQDPDRRETFERNARQRAEDALSAARYHGEVVAAMLEDCGLEDKLTPA